jgi:hypothetical protein
MTPYEYDLAEKLGCDSTPFYVLIAAAYIKADPNNRTILRVMFPSMWKDIEKRYYGKGVLAKLTPEEEEYAVSPLVGEISKLQKELAEARKMLGYTEVPPLRMGSDD